MRRRTFVKAVSASATGGLVGLAGCGAPADEETTETATGAEGTTAGAEGTTETPAGGEGTTTTTETGETTTAAQETQGGETETVKMLTEGGRFLFDPVGLFVEPGDTVKWVLESGSHSTTAYAESLDAANTTRIPENAEPWNSGILSEQGASFSYTFDVKGTYDYFCIPHKTLGMVARIVCGEPGGVEGDPKAGPVPSEQAIVEQGAISPKEFNPTTTADGG